MTKFTLGRIILIAISLIAILTLQNVFFVVQPTELAGIRRFGQVITPEPLGPGLYFKIPFIDTADTLQVSMSTFQANDLTIYTIDNQAVTISVSMSYRIPKSSVLKLLYEIGRAGAFDIIENLYPVVSDRIMRVFAKMNTTTISEQRTAIGKEIRELITQSASELFGIELLDLQISGVKYSRTFEASVEAAVKAKNDAIAAENTVKRVQYEGEQKVVSAKAEADVLITKAEADKKARIFAAEGDARAIELQGEARAKALRLQAEAVKGNPELVEVIKAESWKNWNGQLPSTILNSAIPLLNLNPQMNKE